VYVKASAHPRPAEKTDETTYIYDS